MVQCGYPFRAVGIGSGAMTEVQRTTDMKSVAAFISNLGDIPSSSVDQLSLYDFQEAMGIVLSFLAQTPEAAAS
jgi:hypothetical protein